MAKSKKATKTTPWYNDFIAYDGEWVTNGHWALHKSSFIVRHKLKAQHQSLLEANVKFCFNGTHCANTQGESYDGPDISNVIDRKTEFKITPTGICYLDSFDNLSRLYLAKKEKINPEAQETEETKWVIVSFNYDDILKGLNLFLGHNGAIIGYDPKYSDEIPVVVLMPLSPEKPPMTFLREEIVDLSKILIPEE